MTRVCTCIGCGCDDNHACVERDIHGDDIVCGWERIDRAAGIGVCSSCPSFVPSWDAERGS